ncbi:MAG: ergothioneine biosynthesis protein EgtC [Frankia sp.]|nr:ergothioneine biosynthesis protein EgtC [Frankia sp.]
MCRHLAWLGAQRTLADLLLDQPFGLLRQSWAPRRQRHAKINADGFGVGWYAPGLRAEPARYRRAVPLWTDASFASFAGTVASGCVLAAVRSATVGMPVEESATAPFTHGRLLLSHNGQADVTVLGSLLAGRPDAPPADSRCDSALLAALVFERAVADGLPLARAVAEVVTTVGAKAANAGRPARLNLLVTDGQQMVATTWDDTLCYRVGDDGVLVASEPTDDEPDVWVDVPNHHLLVADTRKVTLSNLIS